MKNRLAHGLPAASETPVPDCPFERMELHLEKAGQAAKDLLSLLDRGADASDFWKSLAE